MASILLLYEDGKALTAHTELSDIQRKGKGKFRHWLTYEDEELLYFSSSDNSDPRKNGRKYRVEISEE